MSRRSRQARRGACVPGLDDTERLEVELREVELMGRCSWAWKRTRGLDLGTARLGQLEVAHHDALGRRPRGPPARGACAPGKKVLLLLAERPTSRHPAVVHHALVERRGGGVLDGDVAIDAICAGARYLGLDVEPERCCVGVRRPCESPMGGLVRTCPQCPIESSGSLCPVLASGRPRAPPGERVDVPGRRCRARRTARSSTESEETGRRERSVLCARRPPRDDRDPDASSLQQAPRALLRKI